MLETHSADETGAEPQGPVQQDLIIDGSQTRRQQKQTRPLPKVQQALPRPEQKSRLRMLHIEDQHAGIDVPGRRLFRDDGARD
jgi:hypothetical protein